MDNSQTSDEGKEVEEMRKIQVLLAFVAVLAFSALAVSSASALEWESSSNKEKPTREVAANSHGTLQLKSNGITITCTGLFLGTVGPGALDLLELAEDLRGNRDLLTCEILVDPLSFCGRVRELVLVHVLNLPWHTLLETVEGRTRDHILPTNAGYEILCPGGFKNKCEGLELFIFNGNDSDGALLEFKELRTVQCTMGQLTLSGTILVLGALVV